MGDPRKAKLEKSKSRGIPSVLPWVVVFLGILLTAISYFPGYMSLDSFAQLAEARSGNYSFWHPPILSWIWSFSDRVFPGPGPIFLLFISMFWIGLGCFVVAKLKNPFLAAAIILGIGLFPSVFALLSTVWKDVGMGASLVLAAGLIALAGERKSPTMAGAALPFLFLGFCSRHEAAAAVLPLIAWLGVVGIKIYRKPLGVGLLLAFCLSASAIFMASKDRLEIWLLPKNYWPSPIQITWVHDLVGLSIKDPSVSLPPYLTAADPAFDLAELHQAYDPSSSLSLFRPYGAHPKLRPATSAEDFQTLQSYWLRAVSAMPRSYLALRWTFFRSSLAIDQEIVFYPFLSPTLESPIGAPIRHDAWNSRVMAVLESLRNSWVFRGWVYLLAGLGLFLLGLKIRSVELSMISLSGLLYEVVHFFTLSAIDFRYRWWLVLSVFLGLVSALAWRLQSSLEESSQINGVPEPGRASQIP